MENFVDNTLVTDVAREVVSEIAPQEMPIFMAASRAYFNDPKKALHEIRSKDDALGFGMEALGVVVTPVVLHIISEVFAFLIGVARKATEDGLAKEIPQLLKAMFKKYQGSQPDVPTVLTREQIGLIHANVLLAAENLRLPPDKAKSLANAITTQLVLPNGGQSNV
ncbi:hypothetical protein OH720_09730 [Pseudomonas sp. WJP1]|uniref:hypothetical protein n=1 Tax=Pseudomonas sp. WJP1 TaxID=2986947 RepID=UPI00234946CE|nr:hypothetical protein [Pseudomonas sp. WJP1]WCM53271.1 hypothetical protein OH720_09730 [Pseudomonas sp. WJP1]